MRKILLYILAVAFSCLSVSAQISFIGESPVMGVASSLDTVFVVGSIGNDSLYYQADSVQVLRWYAYTLSGDSVLIQSDSAQTSRVPLQPVKSTGYKLERHGQPALWMWVFDHSAFRLKLDTIYTDTALEDRCTSVQLTMLMDVEAMEYDTLRQFSQHGVVEREFYLSYDSTIYENGSYHTEEVERPIAQVTDYSIDAPLSTTSYTLSGDQFVRAFYPDSLLQVSSEPLEAYALTAHTTASVRIRENALNEKERGTPQTADETTSQLKGSAPLNVEIMSNASPAAFFYSWTMSLDRDFSTKLITYTEPDFRYTFKKQGTYYLRLEITTREATELPQTACNYQKEYTIEVLNSEIDVPNIFTPNGDGKNDEFRVAYQSLIKFRCRVYNSWGRLVYESTDPATGWDGTINGSPAAEGSYFYLIEATGDDTDEDGDPVTYKLKGTVSLIR